MWRAPTLSGRERPGLVTKFWDVLPFDMEAEVKRGLEEVSAPAGSEDP